MAGPIKVATLSIAVPATTGTYTDTFTDQPAAPTAAQNTGGNLGFLGLTYGTSGLPAASQLELWLLDPRPGVDPSVIASYIFGKALLTADGSDTIPLAAYPGCLFRVKSGGTAGTVKLFYSADG